MSLWRAIRGKAGEAGEAGGEGGQEGGKKEGRRRCRVNLTFKRKEKRRKAHIVGLNSRYII